MIDLMTLGLVTATSAMFLNKPKSIQKRLDECFHSLNLCVKKGKMQIYPKLHAVKETEAGLDLVYQVPYGLSLESFENHIDAIKFSAGGNVLLEKSGGFAVLKIRKNLPRMVEFREKAGGVIPLVVGESYDEFVSVDLIDVPHVMVAGLTNSGKSNFLHQSINTMLLNTQDVFLFILDFKRLEFAYLENHDRVKYCSDVIEAQGIIRFLLEEVYKRQEILKDAKCVKRTQYKGDLPYYVFVIDEFAEICPDLTNDPGEKEILKDMQNRLSKILALSRAVGIHGIVATQRPEAKILPGHLKTHFGAALAFRMLNADNSRVILGRGGAEKLPTTKGRALFQYGADCHEVQVPFFDPTDSHYLSFINS